MSHKQERDGQIMDPDQIELVHIGRNSTGDWSNEQWKAIHSDLIRGKVNSSAVLNYS